MKTQGEVTTCLACKGSVGGWKESVNLEVVEPAHDGFGSELHVASHALVESEHYGHLPLVCNLAELWQAPPKRKPKVKVLKVKVILYDNNTSYCDCIETYITERGKVEGISYMYSYQQIYFV